MHRKPLAIRFRKRTYDRHGGSIKSTNKSAGTREVTEHSCVPKDQDTVQCNEVKFVVRTNEPPNEASKITSVACTYGCTYRCMDTQLSFCSLLWCSFLIPQKDRMNQGISPPHPTIPMPIFDLLADQPAKFPMNQDEDLSYSAC